MKKVTDPKTYEKPSRFIKLQIGDNRIRILDGLWLYKKLGVRMQGRYVAQIIDADEPLNPALAKTKAEPKQQWGWVVWDYRINEPRILEVGPTIGDALANLMNKGLWRSSDVIITKKKTGTRPTDVAYEVAYAPDTKKVPTIRPSELGYYVKYFGEEVSAVERPTYVDSDGVVDKEAKTEATNELLNKARRKLFATLRDKGIEGDDAKAWIHTEANVDSTSDLTVKQAMDLVNKATALEVKS